METQTTVQSQSRAKEFFLNLGAIVSLYTVVGSLINLAFTFINVAYPQIASGYNYLGSSSISFPVATIIIFFPVFLILMWLLEKEYKAFPEKQNSGIHRWLTFITLFLSGLLVAGDLITVIYYFIDGQELNTAFLLKVLVLLVIAVGIFAYYLSDIRGKLTAKSRMIWRAISLFLVVGLIVWGFSVLGSPHTQKLYKYDQQKLNDLMNINSSVNEYYQTKGVLPKTLSDMSTLNYYMVLNDSQTNKPYEYILIGQSAKAYNLCAEFNKSSNDFGKEASMNYPVGGPSWSHPAGRYCFEESISPDLYPKVMPVR